MESAMVLRTVVDQTASDAETAIRQPGSDYETSAYVGEVSAGLPQGDDLTSAELRCDYLLEKLAEEHGRLGHLCEFSDRRVQMVREHQAIEGGKIEKKVAWLHSQIRAHTPGDGERFKQLYGKKSLSLPHGTIGFRATPPAVEILDMEQAVAWATGAGVEVTEKVTRSVPKRAVVEWVKENGELPATDAIRWIDSPETFFVKPEGI